MPDGRLPEGFDGPRACGPYDLAPALDTINLVFRTSSPVATPRAPSMGWDYSHIYNQYNLDNVRIISHQGRIVSTVGIYNTTVQTARGPVGVGGINAVGTHPDYRRLGLATITMEDAQARMSESGMQVGLLSTGITNWYRKLGWERAGQQRAFTFDLRNVTSLPDASDLEMTQDWQSCVEELCALYNAQGVGAVRSVENFALLSQRKTGRIFVARRGGNVMAYAMVNGSTVREYAGAPQDVAALIRQAFYVIEDRPERSTERRGAQQGQFDLTIQTPESSTGLPALLLKLGVPNSIGYTGMLLILDAPGLFKTLRLDASVERRGDAWQVRHGSRSLDLSEGDLVKLVFGPERHPEFPPDLFPIDFYQWPTDRV